MKPSYNKQKKRGGDVGRFTGIPHHVMKNPDWALLSGSAIRLVMELALQYNGYNNGNLCASWTLMKERGFKSESTLHDALALLQKLNFVIRTREGYFRNPGKRCALYALTWKSIDECPGKDLDVGPTVVPFRRFSVEAKNPLQKLKPRATDSVSQNQQKPRFYTAQATETVSI